MDKILLLVSNWKLRQLYHELLLSKNVEVIPAGNIADASVVLMINDCVGAVVDVDATIKGEVKIFLNLRNKHERFSRTKVILLTSQVSSYTRLIGDGDLILNSEDLSAHEIAEKIELFLNL